MLLSVVLLELIVSKPSLDILIGLSHSQRTGGRQWGVLLLK